ncbi:MAG: O-antigen ligase family protein [Maritimibacter sp.]|nr:O-antigen ligase family protein [Maritimibacter sp.]
MTSAEQQQRFASGRDGRRSRRSTTGGARIQAALGWGALAVVAAAILRNGAVAPAIWLLLCLGALVLFAVQVGLDLRNGLPQPARSALWPAVPLVAVVAWLLIQSAAGLWPGLAHPVWALAPEGALPAISAHPDAGRLVVLRYLAYAMVFWVLMRSSTEARGGGRAYIQAIAMFSTALALYGLLSKAAGYNLLLGSDESAYSVRASLWHRGAYATIAVFGVLANVAAYADAVSGSTNRVVFSLRDFIEVFFSRAWIFAFGGLVGLAALAMTLSRGGAAAGAVGVLVLIWALRRGAGRSSLGALAVPIAAVAFVALFMTSAVLDRFQAPTAGARPEIFRAVAAGILDRPLLGHGAGAFPVAFRPYTPASQAAWVWDKAHSSYLENAFEFGLPAAALFYLGLGLIGLRLLSGVRHRKRHQLTPAFALACFAAAAVHAVADFTLQIPAVTALFAAILGIGWGQSFPTRRRSDAA